MVRTQAKDHCSLIAPATRAVSLPGLKPSGFAPPIQLTTPNWYHTVLEVQSTHMLSDKERQFDFPLTVSGV